MRIGAGKEFAILEWGLLFGLAAAAVLISEISGIRQEWEDVIVYTVIVFTVVVTSLRPAWGRVAFWKNLLLIFAAHALVVLMVIQVLPQRRFGIPKLLLVAFGVIESLVIGVVLWKKTAVLRGHKDRP